MRSQTRCLTHSVYWVVGLGAFALSSCSGEDPAFTQSAEARLEARDAPLIDPAAERGSNRSSGDAEVAGVDGDSLAEPPDPEALFPGGEDAGEAGGAGDAEFQDGVAAAPGGEGAQEDGSAGDGNELPGDGSNVDGDIVGGITDSGDGAAGGAAGSGSGTGDGGEGDVINVTITDSGSGSEGGDGTLTGGTGDGGGAVSVEKAFLVSTVKESQGSFMVDDGWTSQPITLVDETASSTKNFTQVDRPSITKSFTQGMDGTPYVETLDQVAAAGILDLLVVIDNSGSMQEEQANLSNKLGPLLTYVADSDWRIGVVTTDPEDGCMRGLISKGDADATQAFSTAIDAGLDGSGNERGIFQAVKGLSCPSSQWLRQNSTVAVLVVSDEDNCSDGTACGENAWASPNYLLDHVQDDLGRTLGTDARIYGIIKHPDDNTCTTAYNDSTQYAQAVAASGGTWGSICATDYTSTLQSISQDVSSILKDQFALQAVPNPATVVVTLILEDGTRVPATGYSLNGTTVTFQQPPPENSQIEVAYSTYPEPQVSNFALGESPAPGTLTVKVNGVVVPASEYSMAGQELQFTTAPAPESQITASFLKDLPLTTAFQLHTDVVTSTLAVQVNGAAAAGYAYDPQSGMLTFSAPPADGAAVSAAYDHIVGPDLTYDVMTSGHAITSVKAQYADNTPVSLAVSGQQLTLTNAGEHRSGEVLWVQYRVSEQSELSYQLAHMPLAGTLNLTSSHEDCAVGTAIQQVGGAIQVACLFEGMLTVSYAFSYEAEPNRSFTFEEVANPDVGTWSVWVDGEALAEGSFARNGKTITLMPEVPLQNDSVVLLKHSVQVM